METPIAIRQILLKVKVKYEHMVCKGRKLAGLRTIYMGKPLLDAQEVTAKAPKDVLGLIDTYLEHFFT